MSRIYVPQEHSFCIIDGMFEGNPVEIVLHTGKRVWVHASWADERPEGTIQVGDGTPDAFDDLGTCLLSVPEALVRGYYDEQEADSIIRCIDADERLLSYAL